ncbi:hypothetical protein F3K44_31510 [Bacillus megaterium]|nr:hypothetical protein [Priestia megaterium]
MNGASEVTKELAISLLSSKDVYLTSEGKKMLEVILKEKELMKRNKKSESISIAYRPTVRYNNTYHICRRSLKQLH